jgi:serine/threonine-protein kinase
LSDNPSAPGSRTIGRYEIGRELGRGAMGIVYEARDPALGRTIALKTIQAAIAGRQDREAFERRFFAEAQVAAKLQHPGIVVVHDVGRDTASGTLYIALEYLKGRTLAELTDGGRGLAWMDAVRILASVGRALHHAHGNGIVHRDMKPANVMVLDSGETKIMDFGIAKIEASFHHLTTPGEFLGTPLYMAPEQAQGQPVSPRTDVFALGAIGFTLLTGRPAFVGDSVARIVMRVVNEDAGAPSLIAPSVPKEIDAIIGRALAKNPDHRYADAVAMAEDLEAVLEGREPPNLHAPPRPLAETTAARAELVVAEDDPVEAALHALVASSPTRTIARPPTPVDTADVKLQSTLTPGATVPPPGTRRAQPVWLWVVALLVLGGGGAAVTGVFDPPPEPAAATPAPPTTLAALAATPVPEPDPRPTAPETRSAPATPVTAPASDAPGRLAIDFEHPFRSGSLKVWVDGELVIDQKLSGQAARKLVFSVRRGSYRDELEVSPGSHTVKVQVKWDEGEKTERVAARFKPGVTRRLQVRLGWLRKNLSLEWQ